MAGRTLLALTFAGLLTAGCYHKPPTVLKTVEIQTVDVPVPIVLSPPAVLTTPITVELPQFIAPADPAATSALTKDGEQSLRQLLDDLLARIAAWEAWACPSTGCPK